MNVSIKEFCAQAAQVKAFHLERKGCLSKLLELMTHDVKVGFAGCFV